MSNEKTEKHDCGFDHLTQEQRKLLIADGAAILAQIIQDQVHAVLPEEVALELGHACIDSAIFQMNHIIDNAWKLNQLTAKIAITGLAGDARS